MNQSNRVIFCIFCATEQKYTDREYLTLIPSNLNTIPTFATQSNHFTMTGSIVGSDRKDQQHVVPFRQAPSKKTEGGQRRLVLSEEDYTDKLSKIIQRDFFPDVSNLERQNALLDCRLRGDAVGAVAVRRAARKRSSHCGST